MKKLLAVLICFSFILSGCSSDKDIKSNTDEAISSSVELESPIPETLEIPEVSTNEFYNMTMSSVRPVAVMIDNDSDAARPQIGLESANIVYEIIVEGGATRFMALFKDYRIEKVGPVRSSRHYFLDYALENNAIYAHAGWSPQAQADISALGVNNINGILGDDGQSYWRDNTYDNTYHNLYTSVKSLSQRAEKVKGYSVTTKSPTVLKLATEDSAPDGSDCATVDFKYSGLYRVGYVYNPETALYERYVNGKAHVSQTGDILSAKNIIIYNVANHTLDDGENKGRQNLENIGSGEGWYISLGKAQKINWSKSSRTDKTKYTTQSGEEIVVNPGTTYIQIIPMDKEVVIQ